jgi:23S rRNA (guanosine2251-2'-O)-methyltransferase
MVIGKQAVLDAFQAGTQLDRIYITKDVRGMVAEEILSLALQHNVPVNKVPVEKLNGFNVTNHEGCLAIIAKVQYHDLQDIISHVVENGKVPLLLILDGITDIRNIGGIARTAYCCGVDAIIIPDKGVGALNEDAISTSAGALEKMAICRVNSLMKTVDDLHMNGIKVYASEMTASKTIAETDLKEPCAIIMGSEDKGIYPALMKICDERIKIPMAGDFESLNVSVATGIILYEVVRQRLQ